MSPPNTEPWLSILLPAYNVQPFIAECVKSIAVQWTPSIEVIVVEDCSTDGTLGELQKVQQQYLPALQIIRHPHNRGLSAARNTGLDAATGRYIWFIDSDDLLSDGVIAKLREVILHHEPDLVLCDFRMWREKLQLKHRLRGELHRSTFHGPSNVVSRDRLALIGGVFYNGQMHSWSKIALRSLWGDDLRFPVGKYFEDARTTPQLLARARSFIHIPEPWVMYRQRGGSILSSIDLAKIEDMVTAFDEWKFPHISDVDSSRTAKFGVAFHLARVFIGACKHLNRRPQSIEVQRLMAQGLLKFQRSSPLSVEETVSAFLRRGWFWRACRFAYWVRRAGRQDANGDKT